MVDRSGNGNTATLENMSTTTSPIPGRVGQALRFDGINDAVNAGSGSSLDDIQLQGGGGMTVSFWIRPASNATKTIINKAGAANGNGNWTLSKSSASNPARVSFSKEGTVDANKNYNSLLTVGIWQHIVMTWNGSMTLSTGVSMYRNGVLQVQPSATDGSGANSDAAGILCIGNTQTSIVIPTCASGSYGDEDLDDVRLYNRILSTSEIQQLYSIGLTKYAASPQTTATSSCSSGLSCGLIGYWTFDGKDTPWTSATAATTLDKSGNGRTGTLTSLTRANTPVSGKIGQGLKFNVDGYVTTASDFIGTTAITVCLWHYASTVPSEYFISNGKFRFGSNSSSRFGISSDGSTYPSSASNAIPTNRWVHLCGTRDASGVANMYADSILSGTANQSSGTPAAGSGNVTIGADYNSANKVSGVMDDVRIYNRVLSAREIQQIYSLGAGTKQAASPQVTATSCSTGLSCGLVGYWTFDGKDVPNGRVNDVSGNGKHANLVNIATSTFYVPGKVGQAFNFDGVDDYITAGSVSSAVNSVSFWIKATNTTKKILDLNGTASIEVSSGTITANNFTGATIYVNGAVSSTITANKWYFVTVTTGTAINASAVDIGRISSGYFSGAIDDVRMYNRALSAREVGQLYSVGK